MLIKILAALVFIAACSQEPLAEQRAIHDQGVILGLRSADVGEGITAHELVLCAVSDAYTQAYLAENCQLALSSRGGKRVVFTQMPEPEPRAGQRERLVVIAAPVVTGVLAWLAAMRHYHGLVEFDRKQMRKWLKPRAVASVFGVVALGTLAVALLSDQHMAGAAKRAAVRHWKDVFNTDTDFQAAAEVRNVEKILHALAQQLELKVTPAAVRLLAK